MRRASLACIVLMIAGCGKKDDRDLLQGTWTAVSVETGGKALPPEDVKGSKISFSGDKVTVTVPEPEPTFETVNAEIDKIGKPKPEAEKKEASAKAMKMTEYKGTYVLRADKSAPEIDMVLSDGKKEDKAIGIYSLEGDKVRICLTEAKQPRPTKFETAPGTQPTLMHLERAKP